MRDKRRSIHDLLSDARRSLRRLRPEDARWAVTQGAVIVDTRSDEDVRENGTIPGSMRIPLSVLEWALDPESGHAVDGVTLDTWIVLVCAEGYSSSLAAARLQSLGFTHATDLIGGFEAWRRAGLPVEPA